VTDHKSNFIRAIVEEDLRTGKHETVVTRFPPEPNGYPHIGHAKASWVSYTLAADYGGRFHLRFDDTNPETEDMEFVEAFKRDIRWLGFDWDGHLYHASDYFEQLYQFALQLIRQGDAYVCSLSDEDIRAYRGTVTEAGRPSPYRDRSIAENLDLFQRMRAGEFPDGAHVLRAKIDMASPNMKMRDPLLYRIRHHRHYRTGDAWPIYPFYDFTHCLSDAIEGITHSLCTLEFENNRELYDWIIDHVNPPARPRQYEFARLNLTHTLMSKRKLMALVKQGLVSGWDDPRMPTLSGMRRLGYTPEAIRDFCERSGVAKANSLSDVAQLEFSVRDDLNRRAPRVMAVLDPLEVVIEDYPEDRVESWDAPLFPDDVPGEGSRELPFSRRLFIERDDFMENPPKGYYRLAPGREVRLRHGYVIKCERVEKDPATGEIVRLVCSHDPETKGAAPVGRKVKGAIHWVSADHALKAEARLYDRLFSHERPGAADVDFKECLNPDSLKSVRCLVEPSVANDPPGSHYQFERLGYFCSDSEDSKPGALVFNRTVTLRDSWAKQMQDEPPAAPAPRQPAKPAEKQAAPKARTREEIAASKPPALAAAFARFVDGLGLSLEEADTLSSDPALTALFDAALAAHDGVKTLAKLMVNELMRLLKDRAVADLPFGGAQLAALARLVDEKAISASAAKEVLDDMAEHGGEPTAIVEAKGLRQVSDEAALGAAIDKVMADNPDEAARLQSGEAKLLGFFTGRVMKATGGKANPKLVNQLLRARLGAGG